METDTSQKLEKAFHHFTEAMKRTGGDAPIRIGAHIRSITSGRLNSPGTYHADASISDEDKLATYKLLFNAMISKGGPKWEQLSGKVHAGSARVESIEDIEVEKEVIEIPRTPASISYESKKVERKPVKTEPVTPEIEVGADDSADPITKLIIQLVRKHIKVTAGTDEERVEEIARCEAEKMKSDMLGAFDENVKAALNNGSFPDKRVQECVDKAVEKLGASLVQRITLTKMDGSVREIEGRQHYKFPLLLAALSQRLNVALVGPAGSSKTTTAHNAAKALELAFEAISVGPMTSKADLLGFTDAHGKYHSTATVRRAVEGGIMLWDEFDAANASVATYGNMLLANEEFGTAEGMKVKHKDFCLIAGLNTYGMGANRVYVGRNQLDGATLDRFVVIDWDYDEGLEAAIIGCARKSPKLDMAAGGIPSADTWLQTVHATRKACEKLAIRHVVSPRAAIHGAKLLLAGVGVTHVEHMVLFKGLDKATVDKIKADQ